MSSQRVVILDDDPERLSRMRAALQRIGLEVIERDSAPEMIAYLERELESVDLISLDHDLGPTRLSEGEAFDPGTGRDVTRFLAARPPVCPVIVHTTNPLGRQGMVTDLELVGWKVSKVIPVSMYEWIDEAWIEAVERICAPSGA